MVCNKLADVPTVAAGEWGSPEKPLVITFVPSGDTGKITKAGTAIAESLGHISAAEAKKKKQVIIERSDELREGPFGINRRKAKEELIRRSLAV